MNNIQIEIKAAKKSNWFPSDKEVWNVVGFGSFLMFRTILIIATLAQPFLENIGSANLNHIGLKHLLAEISLSVCPFVYLKGEPSNWILGKNCDFVPLMYINTLIHKCRGQYLIN